MNISEWILIGLGVELVILTVALVLLYRGSQRRRDKELQAFLNSGDDILKQAVDNVTEQMAAFTTETIVRTVEDSYGRLVAGDLLPSVTAMSENVDKFTRQVAKQQEEGMEKLAVRLTALFTEKMHESLQQELDALSEMSKTVAEFNQNLGSITGTVKMLASTYENIGNRTTQASLDIANSVVKLENSMGSLDTTIDAASVCVERINQSAVASEKAMAGMVEIAANIEKTSVDFASTLSSQNAETVVLLNDAVRSLSSSAELSAKEVFANLNEVLVATNEKFENTIRSLNSVSEDIHKSATEFAFAINSTYVNFSSSLEDKLTALSETVTRSAEVEYAKLFDAAGQNARQFDENIGTLKVTLTAYLEGIRQVADDLRSSSDSFRDSAGESSNLFVHNIDETVNQIFREFDTSLSQIAECLVKSTERIKDAADSLPIAVNALREQH